MKNEFNAIESSNEQSQKQIEVLNADGMPIGTAPMPMSLIQQLSDFKNQVDNNEVKADMNVTSSYWEPSKEGESMVGIFQGFQVLQKNETAETKKSLPTAYWIGVDSDGVMGLFMQGGVVTLEAFKLVPIGTKFKITYKGKSGRTKKFSVAVFK